MSTWNGSSVRLFILILVLGVRSIQNPLRAAPRWLLADVTAVLQLFPGWHKAAEGSRTRPFFLHARLRKETKNRAPNTWFGRSDFLNDNLFQAGGGIPLWLLPSARKVTWRLGRVIPLDLSSICLLSSSFLLLYWHQFFQSFFFLNSTSAQKWSKKGMTRRWRCRWI